MHKDNSSSTVHVIVFITMTQKHAKTLGETYHCKFFHLQNTQHYMCRCKIHCYYCTQHSRHSCECLQSIRRCLQQSKRNKYRTKVFRAVLTLLLLCFNERPASGSYAYLRQTARFHCVRLSRGECLISVKLCQQNKTQ